MADLTLSLGPVDFADFEIPDEIQGGGGQTTVIHKYAGGSRTIDAFGSDDDVLSWSGIFFDQTAESRCQQLDAMRKAGAPVPCSWSSFSYLVVIKSFTWKFVRFYEIHYSISLEVVDDRTQPATQDGEDPETSIQGDLDDAQGYSDTIDDAGLSDLMDGISSTAISVPSITGASSSFLSGFSGQISGALSYVTGLANGADEDLVGQPLITAGLDPAVLASSLLSDDSDSNLLANANAMQNTLGRLLRNVNAITGG